MPEPQLILLGRTSQAMRGLGHQQDAGNTCLVVLLPPPALRMWRVRRQKRFDERPQFVRHQRLRHALFVTGRVNITHQQDEMTNAVMSGALSQGYDDGRQCLNDFNADA